eukprot:CAMPEP_0197185258 /NCGR_PEP_ID=MMETSP1423-20130617/11558_1 /TAXON_ID=476441 /ORGANISM="Pseudo-nitzschia heimii, Strain UNC1101" /LENGTH=67 /DNA_ID=CAMNT_0042636279 /DNA_START=37 /DNA_END=237 /DNA_ORIENTATION=+
MCKNTSPKRPPAAKACPRERTGLLWPSPDANRGKRKSNTFGARLIKTVDENAAMIAFGDTMKMLRLV